jgi:hypothetical protein
MHAQQPITNITLRIALDAPTPPGVRFALQRGAAGTAESVALQQADGGALVFDVVIGYLTTTDGALDFRGPFVQGPRGARFVYVQSGQSAGQPATAWNRRAKIALGGITAALVAAMRPTEVLCAHIAGTAKDGGPPAASVKLTADWAII